MSRKAPGSPRQHKPRKQPRPNAFLTVIDATVEAYTSPSSASVEDVEKILASLKEQYDRVHESAERQERERHKLRESLRQLDAKREQEQETYDSSQLERQIADTLHGIAEARQNRKVYAHMLDRLTKELSVLKQKLLQMQQHLKRKTKEHGEKHKGWQQQRQTQQELQLEYEQFECEVELERAKIQEALGTMQLSLKQKKQVIKRREDFQLWRQEVSKEAANEAFHASAGRLRKLWGLEKLGGSCLQKIIYEQVEKSQATEDGFQKIREVTGLTDVMDIVHKFLNRDVEHEQLKGAVKEAEARLDLLREELEHVQRRHEDQPPAARPRALYHDVEDAEVQLSHDLQEYTSSLQQLESTTVLFEHIKAWARRTHKSLAPLEDTVPLDTEQDLVVYSRQLLRTVDKFHRHLAAQGDKPKKQRVERDQHEQARVLNDKDFLKANARVRTEERPSTAPKPEEEENDQFAYAFEREKCKQESRAHVQEGLRQKRAKDPRAKV